MKTHNTLQSKCMARGRRRVASRCFVGRLVLALLGLLALGELGVCPAAQPPRLQPVANGKWPKYPRGPIYPVRVAGGYAYGCAMGLTVIDVRDPANCVQVGLYNTGVGFNNDLALVGHYAYVGGLSGLKVMDVSDPLSCKEVGSWTNGFEGIGQLVVAGNYVYAVGGTGLKVMDVRDPARPVLVGVWTNAAGCVAVAGNYAYVTDGQGLKVVDVSNPANSVQVGGFSGFSNVGKVAVAGKYAYLTDYSGMEVIDVSNPTNCVWVGHHTIYGGGNVRDIAVAGNYAFVTDTSYLYVIDVSNPTHCVEVANVRGVTGVMDLVAPYAYVSDGVGRLRVIDVGNPANPVLVGVFSNVGSACQVAVAGNYAYVADQEYDLRVLDVSDPARPVEVGGWLNSAGLWSEGVAVAGNYAYVADMDQGLQVIDVSNPASCVRVAAWTHAISGYALRVAVAGKSLCVVIQLGTWDRGLQVIDVTDPANPVPADFYPFDSLNDVLTVGNYAYLAAGYEGLQVMDVSSPTNCTKVGGWVPGFTNFVDHALSVAVAGNYAYLAGIKQVTGNSNAATLQVIDVSNPSSCVRRGGCYLTGEGVTAVAVAGKHALVATTAGLQIVDVSNPANCVRVGTYYGNVRGVTVAGNRVYLAEWDAGVEVLRSLPGVQFTFQVDGTAGQPLTVETATNLAPPVQWTALLTTNVATMPFDFVDDDVSAAKYPRKFYRAHQQP